MISYAGIAYMVYLGSAMIVRSFRSHEEQTQDAAHAPRRESLWQAFVTGAGTNILNPKIGVFYIATMPQFIPAGNSPLGMGLLLAGVHVLLTLAWFTLIITGAYAAKRWLSRPRATRIIDRVAGVVIIGFACNPASPIAEGSVEGWHPRPGTAPASTLRRIGRNRAPDRPELQPLIHRAELRALRVPPMGFEPILERV